MNAYEFFKQLEYQLREGIILEDTPIFIEEGFNEYTEIDFVEENSGKLIIKSKLI